MKRRIKKYSVEHLPTTRQINGSVTAHQLQALTGPQTVCTLPQRLAHRPLAFHHHHPTRTARERLKAQRTTSGKQIETTEPIQSLSEPVEQRLPHPVRRRPQARCIRETDPAAAPVPANDANLIQGAGAADFPSPGPATITVTKASGRIRRENADRTSACVTRSTRCGNWSRKSSGKP